MTSPNEHKPLLGRDLDGCPESPSADAGAHFPRSPLDLAKLEEVARAATEGPWEAVLAADPRGQPVPYYAGLVCLIQDGGPAERVSVVTGDGRFVPSRAWQANALHIATFDPPTVLALIARLREVEEALEPFAKRCDEVVMPQDDDESGLTVRVKHLRRARSALGASPAGRQLSPRESIKTPTSTTP